MSEHQSEDVSIRTIRLVALGVVAVTAACVLISWLMVEPTPAYSAVPPTTLEHGLVEQAHDGQMIREEGVRKLEATEWVDRQTRTVRIPIDTAIDAVVADPSLIQRRPAEARR